LLARIYYPEGYNMLWFLLARISYRGWYKASISIDAMSDNHYKY
jgi:hypothetical protein